MGLTFTKNKDRDLHLNPFRNILIFPTNHSTTWLFVDFLLINQSNTESHKNSEQKINFRIITLGTHGINERLSFHKFIHASSVAMILPIT